MKPLRITILLLACLLPGCSCGVTLVIDSRPTDASQAEATE